MKRPEDNTVLVKSKRFAVRVIKLYVHLCDEHKEYVMSKQLLRCGTSVGANIKEGIRGQSRADFKSKLNIALKEASEAEYWLELLNETEFITDAEFESIITDCRELIKLLISIVKSL